MQELPPPRAMEALVQKDEVISFQRPEGGRILIHNLDPRVTAREIEDAFGLASIGLIHHVIVYVEPGTSRAVYALVTYYSDNSARAALARASMVAVFPPPMARTLDAPETRSESPTTPRDDEES